MTITPHRDAADAMVAQIRQALADDPPKDAVFAIQRQMEIDVMAAVMLGAADLMDRERPEDEAGATVVYALAGGLVSYALTIADGDSRRAADIGRRMCRVLKESVLSRVKDTTGNLVAMVEGARPPKGRG